MTISLSVNSTICRRIGRVANGVFLESIRFFLGCTNLLIGRTLGSERVIISINVGCSF